MKLTFIILASFSLLGCITSETTVTDPDGTVTVTRITVPVPGVTEATAAIVAAKVLDEK